jgi:MFS transporter, OFA family, oxalate/formate antiporter
LFPPLDGRVAPAVVISHVERPALGYRNRSESSMSQPKVMNRWLVVVGAIMIQLALGAIYAWSVFTTDLQKAPYGFTKTQTQVVFSVELAAFAFVMILAGRMQAKFPPRRVAILGGLVMGCGYIAASFVGTSFVGHVLTVGLLGGTGIGLGYVVPIAVGVKWFPDKKGLLTGLAVAGFGFGALLWVKLAGAWGHLIVHMGVANVFFAYGIAFAVIVLIGSLWMVNPPAGYKPEGWNPPAPTSGKASGTVDLPTSQMLRTPQFYALWIMFFCGAMAGLMVIGVIKLFSTETLRDGGLSDAAAAAAAETAIAVCFALANGFGRILWGLISDRIGRKASLIIMFLLQSAVMFLFYTMGFHRELLWVAATLAGFNFGGCFALFAAATADFFGNKNVGVNYGWVFSAYGIGGIVGPIVAGKFGDMAKTSGQISQWLTPFLMVGTACLVAAVLAMMLKPPTHKDA